MKPLCGFLAHVYTAKPKQYDNSMILGAYGKGKLAFLRQFVLKGRGGCDRNRREYGLSYFYAYAGHPLL